MGKLFGGLVEQSWTRVLQPVEALLPQDWMQVVYGASVTWQSHKLTRKSCEYTVCEYTVQLRGSCRVVARVHPVSMKLLGVWESVAGVCVFREVCDLELLAGLRAPPPSLMEVLKKHTYCTGPNFCWPPPPPLLLLLKSMDPFFVFFSQGTVKQNMNVNTIHHRFQGY